MQLQPTSPLSGKPRLTFGDFIKKHVLVKPKIDSQRSLQLGNNNFHVMTRGTNEDSMYAHPSNSLSSVQPPAHTGFLYKTLLQPDEWNGPVTEMQVDNPLVEAEGIPEPVEYARVQPSMTDSPEYLNANTDEYSSYSDRDSDGESLSSEHSATCNPITGESTTGIHSKHNAINIGNRTSSDFIPKRMKLMKVKIPFEEKRIQTHIKQHQTLTNDNVFKGSKLKQSKPWTRLEEKSLCVGITKYGLNWNKILTNFNFYPTRTVEALRNKYFSLKRNGKLSRYFRVILKNAGYKSHGQSESEELDSDEDNRVNKQHKQSTHDWTYQEKENLLVGVERFGFDWEKIHSSFNFSSLLSYSSLSVKLDKLRRHGEGDEILRNYGRKVARGILLDCQAECKV